MRVAVLGGSHGAYATAADLSLLGRDLRRHGRGLDRLGLGELTLRDIRSLLHEGWVSPMWQRVR